MTIFNLFKQPISFCVIASMLWAVSMTSQAQEEAALPLESLRVFARVMEEIKKSYVNPVDDEKLFEYAITGMLNGLDPHSNYLDLEAYKGLKESTSGEFGGLGIEVSLENGFVKVVTPIDDTPAMKAGVQAGDLIIKLDEKSVKGMSLSDAVGVMRGKPGEPLMLTILREGEDKPLEIKVVRDVIRVNSVKAELLEPNYGYIRIAQFQTHTGEDVVKSIKKLVKENEANLNGLVLDLRNNPGGVLQASVAVADAFLTKGVIVYTKGRLPNTNMSFEATQTDPSEGVPLVVLINSGSASASEIVAGALQDQQRALVMGTSSFGKGSVQTVRPLSEDKAIKLTTALYYTPNGRSIQAEGIVPDIEVEPSKVTAVKGYGRLFKEADLRGHLQNDSKKGDIKPVEKTKDSGKSLAEKDYQLYEAINSLKVAHLIAKNK